MIRDGIGTDPVYGDALAGARKTDLQAGIRGTESRDCHVQFESKEETEEQKVLHGEPNKFHGTVFSPAELVDNGT